MKSILITLLLIVTVLYAHDYLILKAVRKENLNKAYDCLASWRDSHQKESDSYLRQTIPYVAADCLNKQTYNLLFGINE